MSLQVLVVEDEPKVSRFVHQALQQAGMTVQTINKLDDLDLHIQMTKPEILVLDRLIGKQDSLAVISSLKRKFSNLKILILSALSDVDERVSGLEVGADDYLPKPFHVNELIARVRALARRESETASVDNTIRFEDLEVHLESQEVKRGERSIQLTAKEFKLLTLLMRFPKKLFSRSELLDRIWGTTSDTESNVVEVTMNRLRAKVDEKTTSPLIHTKRGAGYWFGIDH